MRNQVCGNATCFHGVLQVTQSLQSSSNVPIIIDGMFGIGKTTLAIDIAQSQMKDRHVFWLDFGTTFQRGHNGASDQDFEKRILDRQGQLYKAVTGNKLVRGRQCVRLLVQTH